MLRVYGKTSRLREACAEVLGRNPQASADELWKDLRQQNFEVHDNLDGNDKIMVLEDDENEMTLEGCIAAVKGEIKTGVFVGPLGGPSAIRRTTAKLASACPFRIRLRSSPNDMSNCQCSEFSILQWPRTAAPKLRALSLLLRM